MVAKGEISIIAATSLPPIPSLRYDSQSSLNRRLLLIRIPSRRYRTYADWYDYRCICVYAHILDEDRKVNAQRFGEAFYANYDL